jgi:hypothetical protein
MRLQGIDLDEADVCMTGLADELGIPITTLTA